MTKTCLHCKSPFEASTRELNRGNAKFCSQSCSSSYFGSLKKKPPNVTCAYCGKAFYKRPSRLSQSKSGLYFCCRDHKDRAQRIGGIKAIQPSHYGETITRYRDLAFRFLPNKCSRCDYDKNVAALAVHHKDGNRSNNSLENLEIICCNCHAIEHWS